MTSFQDAFISYGRADSKLFAKKLNDRLIAQGLDVWFDFDDIPLGVDYQKQIDDGIEKSDNFVFIISPHSVNSPYCGLEVELALKYQKRIIPLLHVETINREVWQKRCPQGTDAEWAAYTEKGLHSCFVNMHPEVAKINWVYVREGMDDFEKSFADLLTIFERQRSYVHQHTYFLAKSLDWERNRKETRYLLIGEERQQAEAWLKQSFIDVQPPCVPTDLHCEYITESSKNASNLMTQVFLSWAESDRLIMEKVRRNLIREGLTVWLSKTDIQTGADFQQMINRGIEEASNLVCLISPEAIASQYCQQEIQYALSLNKRIIPLLVRPTELATIPSQLRNLQFINFADNTTEQQYDRDVDKLIRILNQEASYYNEHKILLTRALRWDRQHRNPSMLLRGYNLRHAESWLKVAIHHDQHQPIPLVEEFIQESLRQPTGLPQDVFLSYSRKDSEFARKLNDALQVQGKTTWFDQESIAAGSADFQQEICHGIENSDSFLFVISPCSIESPYCAGEVEYAAKLNKRIITVLYRPVEPGLLPAELAAVQWIDFSQSASQFDASFSAVLRTLDTDPDYLRTHTNLLVRALEWDSRDRDESLLLRGTVLKEIRHWLLDNPTKMPQPTRLQRDYVTAANAYEGRRHRRIMRLQQLGIGLISACSLVAIVAGLFAFHQYQVSERLKLQAQKEEVLAQTGTSEAMFQSGQVLNALLEAMQAGIQMRQDGLSDPKLQTSVVTALQQAVFWVRERQRIEGHDGIIWSVRVSPNGELISSASADGCVKVWRQDGTLLRTLKRDRNTQLLAVAFSPDNQSLAVADADGHVVIWAVSTGQANILQGYSTPVTSLAFSPDGTWLVSGNEDGTMHLWRRDRQGRFPVRAAQQLTNHDAAVRSLDFSPNGQQLASASDDRTVRLWRRDGNGQTLQPDKTLVGHAAQVRSVNFSPNGQQLVSGSWDETIRLWRSDGTPIETIRGHETLIHDVRFTPDGTAIASAGWDKTIKLWTLDGTLITTLAGHSGQVRSLAFNPKNGWLVSAGGDRTIRMWQLRRPLLATLQDHRAKVYSAIFSPNGSQIASAGADNMVRLWDLQGRPLRRLAGHQSVVWSVRYSPDGQKLVSASSDYTVKLWNHNGTLLKTLTGHEGPVHSAEFSPDGKWIASASADQTVRLWRSDGRLVRILRDFKQGLLSVHFSPDGKTLAISSWDNTVQLRSLEGKLLGTLQGHRGWVYDVAFSHDGQEILTGSYDNTARLWTRTGKAIATLNGHEDGVVSVGFSRDDQFLTTASHDHTVKIWRRDGTLLTTLRGHSDRLSDASISPNSKLLVTASEDQTVLLWNLDFKGDLNALLSDGCRWADRYLQTRPATRWQRVQSFCAQYPQKTISQSRL